MRKTVKTIRPMKMRFFGSDIGSVHIRHRVTETQRKAGSGLEQKNRIG
jgi:hypothetical protein